MWSCDTREWQTRDLTRQWSNKEDGQRLSNVQRTLTTLKRTNVALGTVDTLLNPPTEDWWKQFSQRSVLADYLKWGMRSMVGEDKNRKGVKRTLHLDDPSTCLPRKRCYRPCQKYQHGVFPHHWLNGLITVMTGWKRGHEKKMSVTFYLENHLTKAWWNSVKLSLVWD